jgi:hypothetical protein
VAIIRCSNVPLPLPRSSNSSSKKSRHGGEPKPDVQG